MAKQKVNIFRGSYDGKIIKVAKNVDDETMIFPDDNPHTKGKSPREIIEDYLKKKGN